MSSSSTSGGEPVLDEDGNPVIGDITSSESTSWGLSFVQNVDAWNTELWLTYRSYDYCGRLRELRRRPGDLRRRPLPVLTGRRAKPLAATQHLAYVSPAPGYGREHIAMAQWGTGPGIAPISSFRHMRLTRATAAAAPAARKGILVTIQTFADFGLAEPLLRRRSPAPASTRPTPIQAQAIAPQLAGRDILGIAQTGTGKTAAFALPILHQLLDAAPAAPAPKTCRALVLAPTRELAVQIEAALPQPSPAAPGSPPLLVLGGMSRSAQVRAMARGVDVVVATPGRLTDLMDDRSIRLDQTRFVVLDEADRMLDMGFIQPVRKIVARAAPAPAVGALLGHHAGRGRRPRPGLPQGSGPRRGRAAGDHRRARSSSGSSWSTTAAKRARLAALVSRARASGAPSSSPAPSAAPTGWPQNLVKDGVAAEVDPRQQGAERPPARAQRLPQRPGAGARRHRHRRARHRRARRHPRHQLRPARRARDLRPPHRPHRPQRRRRHRHHALRPRRGQEAARRREADPPGPARRRPRPRRAGRARGAGAEPPRRLEARAQHAAKSAGGRPAATPDRAARARSRRPRRTQTA